MGVIVAKMWLIIKRHFLILTILLVQPYSCTNIKADVHFCGFEQTCSGNRTDVQLRRYSCCRPCECADVCLEKGTCCPDKIGLKKSADVVQQQCLHAAYRPEGLQKDGPAYYTRTRCPEDFEDLAIKEKCESVKPESLEDIMLVSSEDGSVIYKNKFCGLCHGEKRTEAWEMVVPESITQKCYQLSRIENMTADTVEERILTHCSINFKRPSNVDLQSVKCFDEKETINRCNQTGNWDVFDDNLENLCLNADSLFYKSELTGLVFNNVHCYLCNMKENVVPESCRRDTNEKLENQALFTLINQNLWATSHDWNKEGKKKCMTHQILDTFFSGCRTLYCPMFSLPFNGKCVPFMDRDLSYRLVVRLVPYEHVNKLESVKNELMSQHITIQRKLGFGQCDLCSVHIFLEKDFDETRQQEMYVSFSFKETNRCNAEYMWSKLISIEKASSFISIRLNKKMERFEVFWSSETQWRPDRYEKILGIGSPRHCPAFPPERGLYCPKVKLTTREYESVLEKHTNAKELLFAPNKEDMNGTIFVCCDNYILKQSASGVQMHVSKALTTMAIFFGTLFIHFSL